MSVEWDPEQYVRFAEDRGRPFRELVEAIDLPSARTVVDLGCGDGGFTATLRDRWPGAHVEGIDSSPSMIEAARRHEVPGELDFRVERIEDWAPTEPVDVLLSNAALQWVPRHLELLGRLVSHVRPGGVLAFQVPGNFAAPSHTIVDELCASARWRGLLGGEQLEHPASHDGAEYLEALLALGTLPRTWETTYCQLLQGEHAVLEWMKGTRLRPILTALAGDERRRAEFLGELGALLDAAYPAGPRGTVLPFRRVFAVATVLGAAASAGAPAAAPAVAALDHVQVAIPARGEERARAFYGGLLGLAERPKPPALAPRGGCWFRGHRVELHLGIDADFRPAQKAHVALAVTGIDALAERLAAAGCPVRWDDALEERRRFYTDDPFGNRLELMDGRG